MTNIPGNYNELTSTLNKLQTVDDEFMEKIKFPLNIIDELFSNGTFSWDKKIFLSFNGGKDCLAAYLVMKYFFFCKERSLDYKSKANFKQFCEVNEKRTKINLNPVTFVYFLDQRNFPIEEDYVIDFARSEGVEIVYLCSNFIFGLNYMIKYLNMQTIIMGTRKQDLPSGVGSYLLHPSTPPYPTFLRFYPCFFFEYSDIWKLILTTKTQYMKLYDMGYSSIGKMGKTFPNANLVKEDGTTLPAWCLSNSATEREYR